MELISVTWLTNPPPGAPAGFKSEREQLPLRDPFHRLPGTPVSRLFPWFWEEGRLSPGWGGGGGLYQLPVYRTGHLPACPPPRPRHLAALSRLS